MDSRQELLTKNTITQWGRAALGEPLGETLGCHRPNSQQGLWSAFETEKGKNTHFVIIILTQELLYRQKRI